MNDAEAANQRYETFLTTVRKTGRVFSLFDDEGPAAWSYPESEAPLVLFWSCSNLAEECVHRLPGRKIGEYTKEFFIEQVLPQLEKQRYWIGVNWSKEMRGLEVSPVALISEINMAG